MALPLIYARKPNPLERARKVLEFVGLKDRLFHAPNQLSGGQQQRVAIARALANEPVLLFADEPTGNISSKQALEVMEELDTLNKQGVTVILVTHEPDIAEHARRMLTMKDGKIVSDRLIKKTRASDKAPKDTQSFKMPRLPFLPSFASFRENLRMAWAALTLNKFRTFLTMLGVILGVATVIVVSALGSGMNMSIQAQMASLGSNLAVLMPGNPNARGLGSAPRFQMTDVDRLKQLAQSGGAVAMVDPTVRGSVLVSYGDNDWSTNVTGAEPSYAVMRNAKPIVGRFYTAQEDSQRARVCLLGKTVISNLYPSGFDPTGTQVEINKTNFTVIGVLPVKGSNGFQDQDDIVLVPLQTAMWRILGQTTLSSIDIEAKDSDSVLPAIDEVSALCRNIRHILPGQPDDFTMRNMADLQNARQNIGVMVEIIMMVIAGVTLLLGGIGIMNIMLVAVKERTKEIGLRKALGARNIEVLFQFMVEALLICLIGGGAGLLLGVGIAKGVEFFKEWPMPLSFGMVLLAVGVS
ncbi:MAG TPA: ABC transporter permease, partial [bacterium]|nr:ABC transporter permease [bacterium]